MESRGRSITVYLAQGETAGIRHAELKNWVFQALLCPRSRLAELHQWREEVERPGIYFLVGPEQESSRTVYIGESESVLTRVGQHLDDPEEFQEVLIVTNKDGNLTKSHVKFLEGRLYEKAVKAGRYKVINKSTPAKTSLPRPEADSMEEYLDNIPLLLGVLGHRILEPVVSARAVSATTAILAATQLQTVVATTSPPRIFELHIKDASARGYPIDDGFLVLKESTAVKEPGIGIGKASLAFRQELIVKDVLVLKGSTYQFARDVVFGSSSGAASVVYGNSANGRLMWKLPDGRSLKEIEERSIELLQVGDIQ